MKFSVEDEVYDDGIHREGAEENINSILQNEKEFYKSQEEVDLAFRKRFDKERQKWEEEKQYEQEMVEEAIANLQNQIDEMELKKRIEKESEEIKKIDPDFDFMQEIEKNSLFATMVMSGESLEKVYAYFNPEVNEKMVEQKILDGIRARNLRPNHMDKASSNPKFDVSSLSEKQISEIDSKVRRGERVSFN